jgi:hypothetical protein
VYGQQTVTEDMQRLLVSPAKDPFSHDATSWMDLVHQLDARTDGTASGDQLIVMMQSSHDWKSEHLVPCILRGRNRSALFRYLLRHPLMGSYSVEVHDIRMQYAARAAYLEESIDGPGILV